MKRHQDTWTDMEWKGDFYVFVENVEYTNLLCIHNSTYSHKHARVICQWLMFIFIGVPSSTQLILYIFSNIYYNILRLNECCTLFSRYIVGKFWHFAQKRFLLCGKYFSKHPFAHISRFLDCDCSTVNRSKFSFSLNNKSIESAEYTSSISYSIRLWAIEIVCCVYGHVYRSIVNEDHG